MLTQIIISVIVFITVILLCFIIYFFLQRKQDSKTQSERLEHVVNIQSTGYTEETSQENVQSTEQTSLRRDSSVSSIPWLNTLLLKLLKNKSKSLMILIEQSGLKIKVSEFVLFIAFITLLGAMLVQLFFHIPLAGGLIGILPFFVLNILKTKRVEAFVKQMPQALDLLSSDLRAGLDVQAGLKHLSEEFSAPTGEEFAKVIVEVNLGLALNEALNNLSARVNTMDVQILCTGIIINRELGGNLSELIGSIAETVRERFRLKGMIKALTAESQMSAMLLLILPIALYIILYFLSPKIYGSFSTDPMGQMILMGCAVSMGIGALVIKKITNLEV